MAGQSDLNIVVKLVDKASSELKGLSKNMDTFGKKVKNQTAAAAGFTKVMAGTALVVGGIALNEFTKFEQTMSGVKAVLSPTTEEFAKLSAQAQKLGKDSKFSQEESAAGMEMLAKNGLKVTEILNGAAEATLNLAAATGSDLSTAADIGTDAMAIFSIEAENMTDAINGISGVTVNSKFNIQDYSLALAQGGGIAATVGVNFNDFNTSIAAISPLFKSGSDAGTSYKVMLQRMIPASDNAYEAMNELGLITEEGQNRFFDAEGQMKSMAEISGILQVATEDLTDENKNMYLSTIFGTDAMRAAAGMAKVGETGFKDLAKSINEVDAAEQAAVRLDNFAGSVEKLMGGISFYMTVIGAAIADKLRPAIDGAVVIMDDFAGFWTSLTPGMQTAIVVIGGVAVAMAGVVVAVGAIGITLPAIVAGFSALASTFAFLLSPIGLIIGAIVALGVAYKTNFGGFADYVDGIVARLLPLFDIVWQKVKEMVEQVTLWVGRMEEPFMDFVEFIEPFVEFFLNNVWGFFKSTFENIVSFLGGVFQVLSGIFKVGFAVFSGIIEIWANLLTGNWQGAWDAVVAMSVSVIAGLLDIFKGMATMLWAVVKQLWTNIKFVFTSNFGFLLNLVKSKLAIVSSSWAKSMNGLKSVAISVWSTIKSTVAGGINWVIDRINSFITKANSIASKVPGVPTIGTLNPVKFQKGGIVGYQTGGIIPGGKNPSDHDKTQIAVDPGELVLNRAQQANLAGQLMGGSTQNNIVNVKIEDNNFYGDDTSFADKIGEMIIGQVSQNLALQGF